MERNLVRRHSAKCPDRKKGPHYLKCSKRPCPLRVVGYDHHRNRVRESLGTRDITRAADRLKDLRARLEAPGAAVHRETIAEAIEAFMDRHAKRAPATQRKYRGVLGRIRGALADDGATHCDQISTELLGCYAAANESATWKWVKDLEVLKAFLRFCIRRKWCTDLELEELKAPRLDEANHVVPFTTGQIVNIIAACEQIGRTSYERRRERAMVLLMRHAGLRLSDVVTLSREHLHGSILVKRAQKNRNWIRVTIPPEVLQALELLPRPKNAEADSQLFFAGQGTLRSLVKGAWRSLSAVFERASVPDGHPHRFRHTLVTELMAKGATYEEIGRILGDSASTIRKHYAKWPLRIRPGKTRFSGRSMAQIWHKRKNG